MWVAWEIFDWESNLSLEIAFKYGVMVWLCVVKERADHDKENASYIIESIHWIHSFQVDLDYNIFVSK